MPIGYTKSGERRTPNALAPEVARAAAPIRAARLAAYRLTNPAKDTSPGKLMSAMRYDVTSLAEAMSPEGRARYAKDRGVIE